MRKRGCIKNCSTIKSARTDCVCPAAECISLSVSQGSSLVCLYKCVRRQMNLTAEVVELLFVLSVCHISEGDLKVRRPLSSLAGNLCFVFSSKCLFLLDFLFGVKMLKPLLFFNSFETIVAVLSCLSCCSASLNPASVCISLSAPAGGNKEPTHSSFCRHCSLCGRPEPHRSTEPGERSCG